MSPLQTVEPHIGANAIALLQSLPPAPIEAVLTVLLNELSAISNEVVLVLDDYNVLDSRAVQGGMVFLLDHLPPRLHLVIASRADPSLPLASSSRFAPKTCASLPTRRRRISKTRWA